MADGQLFASRPLLLLENRVWRSYSGGKMLGAWRGKNEIDGQMPEDWVGSTVHAVNASRPNSPDAGLSRIDGRLSGIGDNPILADIIAADPYGMLGQAHTDRFGANPAVLVKILDAAERLTIQVHPDKKAAKKYLGSSFGKTEAWHVLTVRENAATPPSVLLGFKEDMTREKWQAMFQSQDIAGMLNALHRITVGPGDTFLLEGGVPHAIGEGCLLIEIQEPTDYTFRVERSTPGGMSLPDAACHQGLGFDTMMDLFHYDFLTREQTLNRWAIKPQRIADCGGYTLDSLLDQRHTECFSLERLFVHGTASLSAYDSFFILICIQGQGSLSAGGITLPISQGSCLFMPAGIKNAVYQSRNMTLLACLPPKAGLKEEHP